MSIIADIASLEEQIAALLAQIPDDLGPAHRRFQESAIEAVLSILDDFTFDELKDLDLQRIIEDALADVFPAWEGDIGKTIARRVQDIVRDLAQFYADRGIDTSSVLESVGRSEAAKRLSRFLQDGMSINRTNLQEATIRSMEDAIARGKINRDELAREIGEKAEVAAHHANTQVTTSVAAYNQEYRNTLAEEAGLEHYYYYGTLVAGSRPFCRACAGKTFTEKQIDEMDNSMLNPVKTFKGGWNCRHSWLAVDPEWSEELQESLVDLDTAQTISLDDKGSAIKVFLNKAQARRLGDQLVFQKSGYDMFVDSKVNDTGFITIHPDWRKERGKHAFNHDQYKTLANEYDVASVLADRGDIAELNPNIKNKRPGPSDLVWNGVVYEVKTPDLEGDVIPHGRVMSQVEWDQNDKFILNLHAPVYDWPRAEGRIKKWVSTHRHEGGRITVLHRYDNDRMEEYDGRK